MKANELQELMEKYYYWDLRASSLECNCFADEVCLVYDDTVGNTVHYVFSGCYKVVFNHAKNYDKFQPVKNMKKEQLPYFLQDVKVMEQIEECVHFFVCKINMFPLFLEIWSKKIDIKREESGR